MKTFQDNANRTWTVAVNAASIKRCRDLLDVDLLSILDEKGSLLERLISDPILLCDVVYCLCKPEADAREIGDEQFGQAMAGDAIEQATTALLEDLADFFPSRKRRMIHKALGKLDQLEATAVETIEARLESGEPERRLKAALAAAGSSSGTSPASSASTPDH